MSILEKRHETAFDHARRRGAVRLCPPDRPSPTTISAALVKSADIGGKEVLTDANGMTLYTYDKDEQGVASNCYDKCADELAAAVRHRRHRGRG